MKDKIRRINIIQTHLLYCQTLDNIKLFGNVYGDEMLLKVLKKDIIHYWILRKYGYLNDNDFQYLIDYADYNIDNDVMLNSLMGHTFLLK